ncbi:MAG: methyltransferase domain-containing protein [Dehalococcoidia bacterium]
MLLARRRFLERGLYRPLSGAIIAIVSAKIGDPKQVTARHDDSCIIDAGCGEGSYLGRLQAILRETHRDDAPVCVGVDIAKEAARLAARQYEEPCFVVADTWKRLPVASASVLALLNVFAPRNVAEFARVLSPSGLLLVVIPGDDHLTELRRTLSLLTIQADKEAAVLEQFEGPFRREETRTIVCELDLDREALRDLLLMMPGSRHMAPDAWQAAQRLEHIETSAHFRLMTFSRR